MNKIKVAIFLAFFSVASYAQLTVKGVVLDEKNEPLPYVNIILKNSKKGTSTNEKGEFSLSTKKKRGRIEISYLGFTSQLRKFNKKTRFLTIILKEDANQLDEVVLITKPKKRLKKKENPAYKILKEIWTRKKKNGLQAAITYQYKKNQTVEIGLNNLDTIFLKNLLKKEYKKTLEELPYNEDGVNFYIPIYLSQKIINVYGNNKLEKIREDIEAEKSNGIHKEGFIFDKMSNTFNNIDIYKNNIHFLKKSFVSPISTTGFETYDYVLHDSTIVNNRKLYNIYFFPRRDGDLAFEGNLWVADKIFSITKIKMRVHKDINLNFVRSLSFEKEFFIKNDSVYLPKKDSYSGDFTLTDKDVLNKGLTIKKTKTYADYTFNKVLKDSFYSNKIIRFKPKQFSKKEIYWNKTSNSSTNKETYQLIINLKKKKKISRITNTLNALSTGYFNITPSFQVGQYWNTIVKNSVEGIKLKLGFRTFKSNEDRFRLSGFVGYGTKDKRYKFGLETKYMLSYKPRIAMGIAYLYDVEQLGGKLLNTNGLNANVFDPNALFSKGKNFFLSFVNKTALKFDIAIHKNLHIGASIAHSRIQSASPKHFSIDYLNNAGNIESKVTDLSSEVYIAYTPGRYVYGFGVEQRFGKNLFPSFVINYKKGYKGVLGSQFSYDKIQIKYSQPILLGKLGRLKTTIDAGKTFGKVPIALLSPIPANQTFWITRSTFSLINYYDFVTDTYIAGHFDHHFGGLILNKIPLIKKLKLRSVLVFKTVYGTISSDNIAINKSNITYVAPDNKLYYEYGFGLENIGYGNIRPIRVDFLWRGKHTSVNGLPSPKFAIRIGIVADF